MTSSQSMLTLYCGESNHIDRPSTLNLTPEENVIVTVPKTVFHEWPYSNKFSVVVSKLIHEFATGLNLGSNFPERKVMYGPPLEFNAHPLLSVACANPCLHHIVLSTKQDAITEVER